jgi:hypothetical protein
MEKGKGEKEKGIEREKRENGEGKKRENGERSKGELSNDGLKDKIKKKENEKERAL